MQFRTELTPDKLPVQLGLSDRIVTIGSCFAEVMGSRLAANKLAVTNNPLGTLFNPLSIVKLLSTSLKGHAPDPAGYIQRDGLWFHYDFHSSFRGRSKEELSVWLTTQLQAVGDELQKADYLLLTLGTSVVYALKETGQVVANCHKMPGTLFAKNLSPIDSVRSALSELMNLLQQYNPRLQSILTVSPVRHVREGLVMNGASKALLRTICHDLSGTYAQVYYFPAYELIQDDLRDYRFYEADMIHPNAQAHDYIFAKFAESAFSPDLCAFISQWSQIRRDMAHRPLYGYTEAHRRFLQNLLNRLHALSVTIDTTAERAAIDQQLTSGGAPVSLCA